LDNGHEQRERICHFLASFLSGPATNLSIILRALEQSQEVFCRTNGFGSPVLPLFSPILFATKNPQHVLDDLTGLHR
jgi:hypothetical protein